MKKKCLLTSLVCSPIRHWLTMYFLFKVFFIICYWENQTHLFTHLPNCIMLHLHSIPGCFMEARFPLGSHCFSKMTTRRTNFRAREKTWQFHRMSKCNLNSDGRTYSQNSGDLGRIDTSVTHLSADGRTDWLRGLSCAVLEGVWSPLHRG